MAVRTLAWLALVIVGYVQVSSGLQCAQGKCGSVHTNYACKYPASGTITGAMASDSSASGIGFKGYGYIWDSAVPATLALLYTGDTEVQRQLHRTDGYFIIDSITGHCDAYVSDWVPTQIESGIQFKGTLTGANAALTVFGVDIAIPHLTVDSHPTLYTTHNGDCLPLSFGTQPLAHNTSMSTGVFNNVTFTPVPTSLFDIPTACISALRRTHRMRPTVSADRSRAIAVRSMVGFFGSDSGGDSNVTCTLPTKLVSKTYLQQYIAEYKVTQTFFLTIGFDFTDKMAPTQCVGMTDVKTGEMVHSTLTLGAIRTSYEITWENNTAVKCTKMPYIAPPQTLSGPLVSAAPLPTMSGGFDTDLFIVPPGTVPNLHGAVVVSYPLRSGACAPLSVLQDYGAGDITALQYMQYFDNDEGAEIPAALRTVPAVCKD